MRVFVCVMLVCERVLQLAGSKNSSSSSSSPPFSPPPPPPPFARMLTADVLVTVCVNAGVFCTDVASRVIRGGTYSRRARFRSGC
jgi:hypothetical protein